MMARIVKEQAYVAKRNTILDVVQRLVETKGYEQMTIQDVLDGLQISRGAFYHYFDSKQALLEALVERMSDEVEQLLLPIAHDPELSALDKLQHFFDMLNHWKLAQKPFILAFIRVWYTDDNVIVRQKLHTMRAKRLTSPLEEIIRQGVQEGILTTPYPDQAGRVILSLFQDLGDTLAERLLSDEPKQDALPHIERIVAASTDALERVLGAPPGSLQLADAGTLKEWVF